MARQESDREDLFAEIQAWPFRWELRSSNISSLIVAGIRADDRCSIYFGPDPVYHFDREDHLIRAFVDGHLYRAQGTTLARLRRERSESETTLFRHDLNTSELDEFLRQMTNQIQKLYQDFVSGNYEILRRGPENSRNANELLARLNSILQTGTILAPAYPGRQ